MNLPKAYIPGEYEPNIYALWETSGAFEPTGKGEPYSIVMPPPNANGNLHVGHALMIHIEDVLIRYHRMQGRDVAWIPGADHAGFETWVVYEKELAKEGKSRFDFSREQLYSNVWNFVDKQRGNMELQLRALGASADWSKLVFSLDEKVIKTTYRTFKQLWDKDLIYRGQRLVNYCTFHQTAFADIEVDYHDTKTPLYYLKYGPFELATTRPETKFGDTAVAVHPDDERYTQYVGKTLEIEGVNGPFKVKVVADEMVDREFGTGVVKITPAHDFNDWEVAQRHNLPSIVAIDKQGKMTEAAGRFEGMTILEAREAVVKELEKKNLLIKIDKHYENRVGTCYKCGTTIEPTLMEQWFIRMEPLAKKAIKAIQKGDITFFPATRGQALVQYLENIRDWNLSRQIPWGIPIPAFQNEKDPSDWIFDERVDQETIEVKGKTYRREEDTFDTWFSSGQWPFITTDYLDDGDLARFYPNAVMETGHDILYPWVSRMIMLGLEVTGKVPFKDVYLHGLVLDEKGQKMSKSKGNVVNPMELLTEYGSDALRIGLLSARSAGQNQAFSTSKVVAGRNFANKLWNVARFIEGTLDGKELNGEPTPRTLADHWIVSELNTASETIAKQIEQYRFAEATETVYHTLWSSVADWYIEASKGELNPELLAWVLDTTLRVTHPFAPFVTETIWQTLPWYHEQLMSTSWPEKLACNDIAAAEFAQLQALISEARFVKNELPGNDKYTLVYGVDSLIEENTTLIQRLAYLKDVKPAEGEIKGLRLAVAGREAWLDVDAKTLYEHQSNLEVRLAETHAQIHTLKARLETPSYIEKAPTRLVDESRKSLAEKQALVERLEHELEVLK